MGMAAILLIGYLIFGGDGCNNCVVIQNSQSVMVVISSEDPAPPLAEIQAQKPDGISLPSVFRDTLPLRD
jgi:hypothetical protein